MTVQTSPQITAKIVKNDNIPWKKGIEMLESNIKQLL